MLSTIYHFSLIQAFKVQSIKQHVIFFPRHGLFESWLKVNQDFNFSWESAYKTHLKRLQFKQNIVVRLLTFFATTSGPQTESTLPFLNLLDVLTVNNFYRLHALKFTHSWHKGHQPSLIDNLFQYASSRHTHNTRHASKQHSCKLRPRTNTGKQIVFLSRYQAIDL